MKSFVVFALFVAAALAGPVSQNPKEAIIVSQENTNIGTDGYKYRVETSDGKVVYEEAILKNVGTENEALEVRGEFSYYGFDGIPYTVTYIANEKGFQPSGAHLPSAKSS